MNNEKVWIILENENFLTALITTETPMINTGIKLCSEYIYNIIDIVYTTSTYKTPLNDAVKESKIYEKLIKDIYEPHSMRAVYYVEVCKRED